MHCSRSVHMSIRHGLGRIESTTHQPLSPQSLQQINHLISEHHLDLVATPYEQSASARGNKKRPSPDPCSNQTHSHHTQTMDTDPFHPLPCLIPPPLPYHPTTNFQNYHAVQATGILPPPLVLALARITEYVVSNGIDRLWAGEVRGFSRLRSDYDAGVGRGACYFILYCRVG